MTRARLFGLVVAAILIPACSEGRRVSPNLLNEGFNGTFPGTSWIAPSVTGSATATVDGATGFPAPSLKMTATAAAAAVSTDTQMTFNNPSLTVSITMADLSGGTTEIGSGVVSILDNANAVVASATWNNATGLVTFHINGGAADNTATAASDGNFHRLIFSVTAGGVATWTFDNGAALVTQAGFPPGLLRIRLGATFGAGTAWPSFFFDNVVVTSP